MARIISKLVINFCFLILLSAPVYANIGSITEFKGAGQIKRGPKATPAAKGSRVVKVNFGDPNMSIKKNIPGRKKSFLARHRCSTPGPKFKARYWSCKMWR